VVQKRRTHPMTMNKVSKELERRKEYGEWVPADDVPVNGMFLSFSGDVD
jgi:hypothetical protein